MHRSVVYDPAPFPSSVHLELVRPLERLHAAAPFGTGSQRKPSTTQCGSSLVSFRRSA